MIVYRITTAKWASQLSGSGHPGRWNSRHVQVIYTASTIALACLENLVHRSGEGQNANFRLIKIEIPDVVSKDSVNLPDLPNKWHTMNGYPICQSIGKEWIEKQEYCILQVPSSIIPDETNILINPDHPEFRKISIKEIRVFSFDDRLLSS